MVRAGIWQKALQMFRSGQIGWLIHSLRQSIARCNITVCDAEGVDACCLWYWLGLGFFFHFFFRLMADWNERIEVWWRRKQKSCSCLISSRKWTNRDKWWWLKTEKSCSCLICSRKWTNRDKWWWLMTEKSCSCLICSRKWTSRDMVT